MRTLLFVTTGCAAAVECDARPSTPAVVTVSASATPPSLRQEEYLEIELLALVAESKTLALEGAEQLHRATDSREHLPISQTTLNVRKRSD